MAKVGQSHSQVAAAQAAVDAAELDVGHAEIRAGIAGEIGDKTAQVGQYVQPGTRLLSLVPVQSLYVVANFKETQLAGMRAGQHASVRVDALDGKRLDAVVESFAPGTGAQFSLLPPENATGNFTKIVQRVPVRLRLQADADTRARLVPGLSVDVEIDTSQSDTSPHGAALACGGPRMRRMRPGSTTWRAISAAPRGWRPSASSSTGAPSCMPMRSARASMPTHPWSRSASPPLPSASCNGAATRPMPKGQALRQLAAEIHVQAMVMTYSDCFWLSGAVLLGIIPLTLLLRRPQRRPQDQTAPVPEAH